MKIAKVEKLVPNVRDKNTCVVNIKNLNDRLKDSLKLKKLHWVIRFEQGYWMKPYIKVNTQLRAAAKNGFDNYFFKLMNNSVF